MAEYIFKDLIRKAGLEDRFEVSSAAVSMEEIGNDIYPPAKFKLREHGIPYAHHEAHRVTREEYAYFDKIICADDDNTTYLSRLGYMGEKVSLMMQWAGEERDVSDPWYTRNFEAAYQDIMASCKAILKYYIENFKNEN